MEETQLAKLLAEQRERSMKRDENCYTKAKSKGELTFTLREQDQTAPATIVDWIRRNWYTAPATLLYDAFMDALAMRESAVVKKHPD